MTTRSIPDGTNLGVYPRAREGSILLPMARASSCSAKEQDYRTKPQPADRQPHHRDDKRINHAHRFRYIGVRRNSHGGMGQDVDWKFYGGAKIDEASFASTRTTAFKDQGTTYEFGSNACSGKT